MYSPQRETKEGIIGAMKTLSKRVLLLGLLLAVTLLVSGCRGLLPGFRPPQLSPSAMELTLDPTEPESVSLFLMPADRAEVSMTSRRSEKEQIIVVTIRLTPEG